MNVCIRRSALEQAITADALARKVPPDLVVEELLARALGVTLSAEPWRDEKDRPAAVVLALARCTASPRGITLDDIRGATGWQYRKTAAVLKRLLDAGQLVRTRSAREGQSVGAPAWHYRTADAPADASADASPIASMAEPVELPDL